MLVVAAHSTSSVEHFFGHVPLGGYMRVGYVGVDLFFVLSGFIIFTVHREDIGRKERVRSFLWRRFVRIFPPYWIVLALLIAGRFVLRADSTHPLDTLRVLRSLVLWPATDAENILSVAWTLSFELFFYAVFALAILNKTWGYSVFLAWQIAVLISNIGMQRSFFALNLMNLEFLFGMAAAMLPSNSRAKILAPLGALLFLAAAAAESLNVPIMATGFSVFVYGPSAAAMIYGLKCVEQTPRPVPSLILLCGAASYSIYLVHYPVISFVSRVMSNQSRIPADFEFVVLVASGAFAGVAFFLIAERPLLRSLRPLLHYTEEPVLVAATTAAPVSVRETPQ